MISIPDFQSAAKEFRAGKIDIKDFTQLVFGTVGNSAESSTHKRSGRDSKPGEMPVGASPKRSEPQVQNAVNSNSNESGFVSEEALGLCLDENRQQRCGFPEVIYGEGKTQQQIEKAARKLLSKNQDVLVTRISEDLGEKIAYHFPSGVFQKPCGTLRVSAVGQTKGWEEVLTAKEDIAVVCAGTSDQSVAIETVETLAWMGLGCQLIMDVGVAGPDRLIPHLPALKSCKVVIVIAGMDGALASVVGGHLQCPVIAVPTSVGYGACFGGVAPLLSMLSSCASNVLPVNIDAGFKAAYFAGILLKQLA